MLERLDAIAQPGGLLVAKVLGQVREPHPKTWQRSALEETIELLGRARSERAGGKRRPPAARDRAEWRRSLLDDEIVASAPEVEAVLFPTAARIGRWGELPNQPQLFECGLELRAEHVPLDPMER